MPSAIPIHCSYMYLAYVSNDQSGARATHGLTSFFVGLKRHLVQEYYKTS